MSNKTSKITRRQILRGIGGAGLLGLTGAGLSQWKGASKAHSNPGSNVDPKFLIVLTASGGASLIDSFLAIRESESANASVLNVYPDKMVTQLDGSPFRALDQKFSRLGQVPYAFETVQSSFLKKHKQDMMVVTQTGSSVTHDIAQRRSVTGNEIWSGRTLQEMVAYTYGESYALPNVLLATGTNFIEHGTDSSLPDYCFGEKVTNPGIWPLSLDGTKGVTKIDAELIRQVRLLRNESIDPHSRFTKLYSKNSLLNRWMGMRGTPLRKLENQDLITKLMMYPDSEKFPLKKYGLSSSPSAALVREKFPRMEVDPLEAQAALAFLLLKFRVSVTATIGPRLDLVIHGDEETIKQSLKGGAGSPKSIPAGSIINTPIAFDFCHQAHRGTQAFMWDRILTTADRLIDLLKSEEYENGESFWDRTMIYIATDFGRSRKRPSGAIEFGSSHNLNNGFLILSPLVNGNKVLGGVDPDTAMTYGWDLQTGAPDKGRHAEEKEIFAGILQALGVDTSPAKLPDVRAMRKKA